MHSSADQPNRGQIMDTRNKERLGLTSTERLRKSIADARDELCKAPAANLMTPVKGYQIAGEGPE